MKFRARMTLCLMASLLAIGAARAAEPVIHVEGRGSLVNLSGYALGQEGPGAQFAKTMQQALKTNDPKQFAKAAGAYKKLFKEGEWSGEYGALAWLAKAISLSPSERETFFKSPEERFYYDFFTRKNNEMLNVYLTEHFVLKTYKNEDPEKAFEIRNFLEELIIDASPLRKTWEDGGKIVELLNLKPGMRIADVGAGPGYYSTRMAQKTGPEGRVYAIDIKQDHLTYLNELAKKLKLSNITTIKSKVDDISLNRPVDLVFMNAVYHIIYINRVGQDRRHFNESVFRVIRPGGRLVIVDNGPSIDPAKQNFGPYIDKRLIIAQLEYLGYKLERQEQLNFQQYMLVFQRP